MIVDGNIVQGIYVYSPSSSQVEFTKDDLVVSNENIYICTADSVVGVNPSEDTENEYYRPYPGSKISSASEFLSYIENGGEDKYISSQALLGILQGYQFGLSMTGVITDYIDKNGNTRLGISNITANPLDNLMFSPDLNRGIVKVSHELGQIVDGEVDGTSFSTLLGDLEKSGYEYNLILHQYTYKPGETTTVRIQELCSPLTGVTVYRYMTWEGDNFPTDGNVISSWKSTYSYSSAILDKMNALDSYYHSLANQVRAKAASVVGSFRFKEVQSSYDSSVTVSSSGIYTICLTGLNSENHRISESVTLKTTGSFNLYFNYLPGYIQVTALSETSYRFSLVNSPGTSIISVYSRSVYAG